MYFLAHDISQANIIIKSQGMKGERESKRPQFEDGLSNSKFSGNGHFKNDQGFKRVVHLKPPIKGLTKIGTQP